MSFLEMLDLLNEKLIREGKEPVEFGRLFFAKTRIIHRNSLAESRRDLRLVNSDGRELRSAVAAITFHRIANPNGSPLVARVGARQLSWLL